MEGKRRKQDTDSSLNTLALEPQRHNGTRKDVAASLTSLPQRSRHCQHLLLFICSSFSDTLQVLLDSFGFPFFTSSLSIVLYYFPSSSFLGITSSYLFPCSDYLSLAYKLSSLPNNHLLHFALRLCLQNLPLLSAVTMIISLSFYVLLYRN